MKKIFKNTLISFDALSLMVYVYVFKNNINITINAIVNLFKLNNRIIIYIALLLLSFILITSLTYIILKYCMSDCNDKVNNIVELKEVTNEYMPIYLGYIFVAVSINDNKTFILVFLILLIILLKTQIVAFNPMFCLMGYHYYRIKTSTNRQCVEVFIMTKRKNIKDYKELQFKELSKVNEFTYIDKGG